LHGLADYRAPSKICPRAENNGATAVNCASLRHHGRYNAVLNADLDYLCLLERQIILPLKRVLHYLLILAPISLCAKRMYRRAFAAVEHSKLYTGLVGAPCHLTAERVKLAHEMAFACAADIRIARHIANSVEVYRKADDARAETRGGQRGLNPRMPRAYNGDIELSRFVVHRIPSP